MFRMPLRDVGLRVIWDFTPWKLMIHMPLRDVVLRGTWVFSPMETGKVLISMESWEVVFRVYRSSDVCWILHMTNNNPDFLLWSVQEAASKTVPSNCNTYLSCNISFWLGQMKKGMLCVNNAARHKQKCAFAERKGLYAQTWSYLTLECSYQQAFKNWSPLAGLWPWILESQVKHHYG